MMLLWRERLLRPAFAAVFLELSVARPAPLPFMPVLRPPFRAAFLTVILRLELPIHASCGSLWVVSSRREPSGASCAPVFKPLFFQVKRLPCGSAVMVSAQLEDLRKAADHPVLLYPI